MYKIDIEELNIQGEEEIVKSCYFEYRQNVEMFEYAFSVKRDFNKIFLDEHEILQDWKQGDPKIKSFHYRNYVLCSGLFSDTTETIKFCSLVLHGSDELVISNARQLLQSLKNLADKIPLIENAINEHKQLNKE